MTLHEFFESVATDCLGRVERGIENATIDDGAGLQRAVRSLAGVARLAEQPRLHDGAATLAAALRQPEARLDTERVRETLVDLHVFLNETEAQADLDARLAGLKARWGAAVPASGDSLVRDDPAFLRWVARETAGIVDTMERGVQAFAVDPEDREWLGTILRRQRSLLGAARLSEVAIVGETLRAVEDLSELIVRLNVPIKMEWLDGFRSARDVLRAAADNLARGEQPDPINALSRLRTLRTELHDRFGARVSAAAGAPAPQSGSGEIVVVFATADPATATPIEGTPADTTPGSGIGARPDSRSALTALERARALRPVIDAGADRAARAAVAELYDLLREALP
jgi:hypothetical protein